MSWLVGKMSENKKIESLRMALKKTAKGLTGFFKPSNEKVKSTSTSGNGAAIASGDPGDGALTLIHL